MRPNNLTYTIKKEGATIILDNQTKIKWKEVFYYPLPLMVLILLITRVLIAVILLGALVTILFVLYKIIAWAYHFQIRINFDTNELTRVTLLLNNIHSKEVITNKFGPENLLYKKLIRSGTERYVLSYQTHKIHDLYIFKNAFEKDEFDKFIRTNK